MSSKKGKPQPQYSENFKAVAVAKLYSEGYPEKQGALRLVAKNLEVSHPTLARWAKGGPSAPNSSLIKEAVFAMQTAIEDELEKILGSMEKVREKADYKTLAIAFGILTDKYQLIRGAPTSRTERVNKELENATNDDLERIIAEAEKMAEEALGSE